MLKQQLIRRFELKLIRKSDLFDENYYRKAAGIPEQTDAIAHYYDGGWRNADPSMRFNQENYLEANPDVLEAGLCPLAHYLRYGYRERRRLAVNSADECYHRYAAIRELKRLFYELRYFSRIRKNRTDEAFCQCDMQELSGH